MTKPEKVACRNPKEICAQNRKSDLTKHISQDGYALVLGNAVYSGGETRYPGMVHQVIRADYLMAAKGCREFDPSNVINRVDIEVRNLADWYGKSAYCMTFDSDDQDNMRFRSLEYKKKMTRPRSC